MTFFNFQLLLPAKVRVSIHNIAFSTLIPMAPIHCRGSIAEQVMYCYISPNPFPKRNKLIYIIDGLKVSTFIANLKFSF